MENKKKLPKPQAKSNTAKTKKEAGKWCEFHKSPTHNTSECRAKQSPVAEIKASESNAYSDTESKPEKGNDRGKKIIDAEPNATVATTKIQKEELEDSEEEKHLFHSQMWVKGSPLQFIVDSGSQKEPDFSRVHEVVGFADHNTPVFVHHRVASPRTGSPRQPTMLPSLHHQALHR